jgi:hypothetical protein
VTWTSLRPFRVFRNTKPWSEDRLSWGFLEHRDRGASNRSCRLYPSNLGAASSLVFARILRDLVVRAPGWLPKPISTCPRGSRLGLSPASPRGDAGRRPSLIELLSRALTSCPDPRSTVDLLSWGSARSILRWARASYRPSVGYRVRPLLDGVSRNHPCRRDAISPIPFRPRGFSPPRRFPPHMGCRLEACCRPWGSPCFTRSHDWLRVVRIVILAALHPPEDIPPHQHLRGHPR